MWTGQIFQALLYSDTAFYLICNDYCVSDKTCGRIILMYNIMSFLCGLLFGAGLTISNMINPNKVLNFLDINGFWDPSLLIVMAVAVTVTFLGYKLINKFDKPILCDQFYLPEKKSIEKKLILGSIIFGIGWGVAGYCPGPSISALTTFNSDPVYFVIGLIAGSWTYYWLFKKKTIQQ
ncbi:TPA: transporter [Legionella pneumophila subsp. pneumophila]|nr:transporter [Legionella pneumophila subsp. pneumophila]